MKFKPFIWVVIAGMSMAIAPAQAQVSLGFHFGDEITDFYPQRIMCLTDRQIRNAVAGRGYTDIFLNVPNDKRIQVRASRDGWVYLLDYDFCADRIVSERPLRAAR